jgi:hypothetical protein
LKLKTDLEQTQSGQAMTEFVVTVAYIFLGRFVLVPMFGKIMDMQYQNQQAARYVAWERTVWFDQNEAPDESVQSNEYWESVATRNDDDVMTSMENRFFYDVRPGILKPVSSDDLSGQNGETSPVWTYVQSKKSMYGGTTLSLDDDLDAEDTPSIAYDIINVLNDGLEVITSPINTLLGAIGGDNDDFLTFAYETKNYYSPILTTQVAVTNSQGKGTGVWDRDNNGNWGTGIEDAVFQRWDGALKARSAVLADGWNTQSLEHYQQRANDYVPSTVFDNALFDAVITVASFLEGGPSNSAIGKLEFGAVGIEPMPAEEGTPLEVSEEGGLAGGFYYYDD